jgi:hypothetical protein
MVLSHASHANPVCTGGSDTGVAFRTGATLAGGDGETGTDFAGSLGDGTNGRDSEWVGTSLGKIPGAEGTRGVVGMNGDIGDTA